MDQQIIHEPNLRELLSEVTMKNTIFNFKWEFQITRCMDKVNPGWFVNIAFERPDTETNEMGIGYGRKEFIAIGTYESGIVKTAWLLLELLVRHELMEAFRWKNKRIFNPHNSVYDLAKIQEA